MSLRQKTIKALIWAFGARFFRQTINFVILAILARLLEPNDFGLLGMATVFYGLAMIFSEMGISTALIQKKDADNLHFSSVFWLNVATGILLTLLMVAISPLVAIFYGEIQLRAILSVIALNFVISSFSIVQRTIFKKQMNFKIISVCESVAIVISGVIGVYMAFTGFGVWSLVSQMMTFTLANTVLVWMISSWRPKFVFSLNAIKDIFHFSINITAFRILNYFGRNVDYLLIGKFLGAQALGYYTLAYKLMLVPLQNFTWIVNRVMFPAYSKIQDDKERVRKAYMKVIKAISLITAPLMLGLMALAPEFVLVVFGAKWQPAILLIRILCICGFVQSIHSTLGALVQSQGKANLLLKLGIQGTFFTILAITIGLRWGIYGVAILYTSEQLLWSTYAQNIGNSLIGLKLNVFVKPIIRPFTIALFMSAGILILKPIIKGIDIINLICYSIAGFLVYAAMIIKIEKLTFESIGSLFKGNTDNG